VGYLVGPFVTATGPQPKQPGESRSGLFKLGLAGSAFAASGFIGTKRGRLWDHYLPGIRAAETAFPAAILRTFRVSEFLSPFESWNTVGLSSANMQTGGKYAEFLKNTFGAGIQDISMARTGAMFGDVVADGRTVGMGLQMKAGTQRGATIADYYARISGTSLTTKESLNEALLKSEYFAARPGIPYGEWVEAMEPSDRTRRLILGSKFRDKIRIAGRDFELSQSMQRKVAKVETIGKLMRAKSASTAGRLNTLLSKPLEFLPQKIQDFPLVQSMAIKPGSTTQMMGRFTKKAIVAGAAWKGLEYYDYLRSQGSPWAAALGVSGGALAGATLFKGIGQRFSPLGLAAGTAAGLYASLAPRFDKGLFHGAASVFTDANVARAHLSRSVGLTESLQRQEEVTPGLVSTKTAIGFAGVGAISAGLLSYGGLLNAAARERWANKEGITADIIEKLRESRADKMASKLWDSRLGKGIGKLPLGKYISKIKNPMMLGAIGGLAAYSALSTSLSLLSGNFGAALPGASILGATETPEELQAIYSGEKDVAVRKGRWWEFGRCLIKSTTCKTLDLGDLEAEEVEIGDMLIGRDHEPVEVIAVYKRKYNGEYLEFSSAFDRDIKTEVTPNHIIPVLDKSTNTIYETEASNIKLNSYVETPIEKLDSDRSFINVLDIINESVFVDNDDRVYAAQKNWYSGKLQKSGTHNIPTSIELDYDFGLLMGYFLAEGNISFNKNNPTMIETVHAKHEKDYVDDIIKISEKIFGVTPTVRFKTTGEKTKEGCWIVRICSAIVAKLFRWSFYPQQNYYKYRKQIPIWCLNATKDFKNGLIEGYYRGDGHWDSTKVISSSKKVILERLQLIAFSIGELVSIGPKEENDYLGRWRARFVNKNATNPALILINNRLFSAVRSVETKTYDDIVYDFEVDHPDHLFVAGTFLVHNSSAYEGGRIEYYRPHFMKRLESRSYQKGIYGTEEERWDYDPMLHPLKALFGDDDWKYHYEQKHQYDRPAPLTGTYGEDIPFIGPLVAATVGKLIKPRKLIRPEEWMLDSGEYVHRPDPRGETEPSYQLGGLGPGAPVSPDDTSQLLNELNYRRREAVGLIGFAEGAIQKSLTGREEVFQNLQTLGVMGKETGSEYWLWSHLNVGGAMGTSEPIRRFIPHTRSYLEEYNPLKNDMPSWMPQNYFLDFSYGNPFDKIKEAEIRLPGPGYEALHPELQGMRPEEYPLAHRLKILGDVAMWSSEYKNTLSQSKRDVDRLSDRERHMVMTTEEQVRSKKTRRKITEYRFRPELLQEEQVTVTDVLDPRTIRTKEYGDALVELQGVGTITNMADAMSYANQRLQGNKINIQTPVMDSRKYDLTERGSRIKAVAMMGDVDYGQELANQRLASAKGLRGEFEQLRFTPQEQLAGMLSESALHNIETPIEMLTPMSPASKLIRQRSAIEEYIATEAVGTGSAFWDKPIENFIKPAADMTLNSLGFDTVPQNIKQRRDINEYFDMLSWTKSKKLEDVAIREQDSAGIRQQQEIQKKTMFGVDAYGSPTDVMRALPRRERDFFAAFSQAATPEERAEISKYIPENEQRVYTAQWLRQEEASSRAKKEANLGTLYDDQILATTQMMRKSEGFGMTPELEEMWMEETNGEIPFDDWIRQKKADEYFASHSLPGADWLGWHPSVDMDDVKLKYVEMNGLDHHEFDLWGTRKGALARKPYINKDLINQMGQQADYDNIAKSRANAKAIAKFHGSEDTNVQLSNIGADLPPRYDIEIVDKREDTVRRAYQELGA